MYGGWRCPGRAGARERERNSVPIIKQQSRAVLHAYALHASTAVISLLHTGLLRVVDNSEGLHLKEHELVFSQ